MRCTKAFDVEPYPTLRYTKWDELADEQQLSAQMLGYNEETWNQPGMADIEYYSWWYFESTDDNALDTDVGPLDVLGFTEDTWVRFIFEC